MRRNYTQVLAAALLLLCSVRALATYTPVSLTGFKADVVANGIGLPTTSTTLAYDSASATANYVLIAQDYQATSASALPTYYLPLNGTINSLITSGLSYQLAPYSGNNSLRLVGTSTTTASGTLTFPLPNNLIGDVYILGSTGSGTATASATITFSDNTTQSGGTFVFSDWFYATPYAAGGFGRASRSSGTIDASSGPGGNPRFYEWKIPITISNYTKTIKSITITRTTGSSTSSVLNIMAVTVDHQSCLPPQNLSSSSVTMTTANFNWTAISGATGYEYAITTSATPPASGTPVSTNAYNATGLNNGTNYYFHVRSKCSPTSFSIWNTTQFTTVACPTVPTNTITVSSITTVSASINWTAVSGSNGYEWALTQSSSPPSSGTQQSANSYNPTGLFPGTTYYFHIRNQCLSPSNSVWTTKSFTTLACPSAGTPTITSNTPGSVTFTWPGTTTPGVASYQYSVSTSTTPGAWQTASGNTATVNNLVSGSTYYAHVRSNCTNSQSPTQYVMFINPFPPCFTPGNLTISNVNMHGASVVWNASSTVVQGYQYNITTNPNTPSTGTMTTDTFVQVTNLTGGQKYYVYVRTLCGQNVNNVINYSSWALDSFTTPVTCGPNNILNVSNVTSNSADINWNSFPGIYGYEYIMNNSATPPGPGATGLAINYNTLAATNLLTGTTYYFYLRTRCDTFNYSPWTSASFTTSSVCTSPSTPVLTALTPTTASFAWSYVSGAQQYQYSVTTNSTPVPGNNYTSLNNVKVISLTPGTPYYFHVRAYCSPSDLSAWETTSFSTAQVSVSSIGSGKGYDVVVYPNPVHSQLQIEISGKMRGDGMLRLYDLSGKILKTIEVTGEKLEINMEDLPNGLYLLRYMDAESSGVLKVQKQ